MYLVGSVNDRVIVLTETPLGADEQYIQPEQDRIAQNNLVQYLTGYILTDQPGALYIEVSNLPEDWVPLFQVSVYGSMSHFTNIPNVTVSGWRKYRCRYQNGPTAQSFFKLVLQVGFLGPHVQIDPAVLDNLSRISLNTQKYQDINVFTFTADDWSQMAYLTTLNFKNFKIGFVNSGAYDAKIRITGTLGQVMGQDFTIPILEETVIVAGANYLHEFTGIYACVIIEAVSVTPGNSTALYGTGLAFI